MAYYINETNNSILWLNNETRYNTDSSSMKSEDILQLAIYITILVVGCVGNTLVISYFGFKKKVKQRFSHYLINLAFVDLLTSIFTPINFIYVIISKHQWNIGTFSCIGFSSIGPLTVNVSAWIITSIAIERHHGIKNPLLQRYSRTRIYLTMMFIWVLSIGTLVPYMMSLNVTTIPNSTCHICKPEWSNAITEFAYSIVVLFIQSILPSIMMAVMFGSIYKTVRSRERLLSVSVHYSKGTPAESVQSKLLNRHHRPSCVEKGKEMMEKRDKKLFNMLIIALAIFMICSLPYNIFYTTLLYMVRIQHFIPNVSIYDINVWLATLVTINSCINFFIYAGVDKSFRAYCKSKLCNKKIINDWPASFTSRLSLSESTLRRGSSSIRQRGNIIQGSFSRKVSTVTMI